MIVYRMPPKDRSIKQNEQLRTYADKLPKGTVDSPKRTLSMKQRQQLRDYYHLSSKHVKTENN